MDKYTKHFIEKYPDVYDYNTKSITLIKVGSYISFYDITHQNEAKKQFVSDFNTMLNYNHRKDKIKRIINEN